MRARVLALHCPAILPHLRYPASTPKYKSWIIERLDRRLADVIGSNTVEKCDVTLSSTIKP